MMGWEDLEVVDPEADHAKKGEEASGSGVLEQVRRSQAAGTVELRTAAP
jgi:hypothetical protein